jgi:hypothetical protein
MRLEKTARLLIAALLGLGLLAAYFVIKTDRDPLTREAGVSSEAATDRESQLPRHQTESAEMPKPVKRGKGAVDLFRPDAVAFPSAYTSPATELERMRLNNHRSLSKVQKNIRRQSRRLTADPDAETLDVAVIDEAIEALYRDALIDRLLAPDASAEEKAAVVTALENGETSRDLAQLEELGPTMELGYIRALASLEADAERAASIGLSPALSRHLLMSVNDLARRRKRVSDNFYKYELRTFLLADRRSVREKLDYLAPFVRAQDWSIVRYGESFLREWRRSDAFSRAEREEIAAFLTAVEAERSK